MLLNKKHTVLLMVFISLFFIHGSVYADGSFTHLRDYSVQPVFFDGKACRKDILRLCRDVTPGRGRIIQCLVDNIDKASYYCSQYIKQYRQTRHGLLVCSEEGARLCSHISPGGGRRLSCLVAKKHLLSRTCQQALKAAQDELQGGW